MSKQMLQDLEFSPDDYAEAFNNPSLKLVMTVSNTRALIDGLCTPTRHFNEKELRKIHYIDKYTTKLLSYYTSLDGFSCSLSESPKKDALSELLTGSDSKAYLYSTREDILIMTPTAGDFHSRQSVSITAYTQLQSLGADFLVVGDGESFWIVLKKEDAPKIDTNGFIECPRLPLPYTFRGLSLCIPLTEYQINTMGISDYDFVRVIRSVNLTKRSSLIDSQSPLPFGGGLSREV